MWTEGLSTADRQQKKKILAGMHQTDYTWSKYTFGWWQVALARTGLVTHRTRKHGAGDTLHRGE